MNRPHLKALQKFNVDLCAAVGAGKGRDTTPEASAAWRQGIYENRVRLAELIHDAESELHAFVVNGGNVSGHTNGRYFIGGMRDALESETRP